MTRNGLAPPAPWPVALLLTMAVLAGCGHEEPIAVDAGGTPAADQSPMAAVPGGPLSLQDNQELATVDVAPFRMDRTEVTVAMYAACVQAGRCTAPHLDWQTCTWPERVVRPDLPVNCIDWNQAEAFCTWAGKRLPTEAEWAFAAGGGRTFPWSEASPGGQTRTAAGGPCPVGSFSSSDSPFGLSGMAGNVWEWTTSEERLPDGSVAKVLRGGGWNGSELSSEPEARISEHQRLPPDEYAADIGFRCAADPLP